MRRRQWGSNPSSSRAYIFNTRKKAADELFSEHKLSVALLYHKQEDKKKKKKTEKMIVGARMNDHLQKIPDRRDIHHLKIHFQEPWFMFVKVLSLGLSFLHWNELVGPNELFLSLALIYICFMSSNQLHMMRPTAPWITKGLPTNIWLPLSISQNCKLMKDFTLVHLPTCQEGWWWHRGERNQKHMISTNSESNIGIMLAEFSVTI